MSVNAWGLSRIVARMYGRHRCASEADFCVPLAMRSIHASQDHRFSRKTVLRTCSAGVAWRLKLHNIQTMCYSCCMFRRLVLVFHAVLSCSIALICKRYRLAPSLLPSVLMEDTVTAVPPPSRGLSPSSRHPFLLDTSQSTLFPRGTCTASRLSPHGVHRDINFDR
jgi:hypothetical protein